MSVLKSACLAVLAAALLVPGTAAQISNETVLLDVNGSALDFFGGSQWDWAQQTGGPGVAVDGDVLVVGQAGTAVTQAPAGSATVFRWMGTHWRKEQELIPGASSQGDQFGFSVGVSGDVIVVGAPDGDGSAGNRDGFASVYRWDGSTWVEEQQLVSSDGGPFYEFGFAVAVRDDLIVVGDVAAGASNQGTASVFRWDGTLWIEEQVLSAPASEPQDMFGAAVDLAEDLIVVGAPDSFPVETPGFATVFRWDGTSWQDEQVLSSSIGEDWDLFGAGVAVSGDVIVVGAPGSDDGLAFNLGAATVFRWDGSSWIEEHRLGHFRGTTNDRFGASVSAHGDWIAAGSPKDDIAGTENQGSATLFRWNGTDWIEAAFVFASDGGMEHGFGMTVDLSDDRVVVAAPLRLIDGQFARGVVYVYDISGDP